MAKQFAKFDRIEHNESITDEFIDHLQFALLLALREQKNLDVIQYRNALERLQEQRRFRTVKNLEQEGL